MASEYYVTGETILLTKTTAVRNEDALSYLKVRGLYYLAVVFVATIYVTGDATHFTGETIIPDTYMLQLWPHTCEYSRTSTS